MTPTGKENISVVLIERFSNAYAGFTDELKQILTEVKTPEDSAAMEEVRSWREIFPVLEEKQIKLQSAVQNGDTVALLVCARESQGLAKHLDRYMPSFAGAEHQQSLDRLLTEIVLSACRICDVAKV